MGAEKKPDACKAGVASRRVGAHTRFDAHDIAASGLLACIALVFGYIEALFPLPVPIPGIKLGLGNVVVLFAIVAFGWRAGVLVMLVKVMASALLFGNPTVFFYSLAGGVASCIAMCAGVRLRGLSLVGVSMLGGAFHMAGQLAVVAAVLASHVALAYLPVLLVAGTATGCLVGYVCRLVVRTVGRSSFFAQRRKRLAYKGRADAAPVAQPAVSPAASSQPAAPSATASASQPAVSLAVAHQSPTSEGPGHNDSDFEEPDL